jgi:hypothetical protein
MPIAPSPHSTWITGPARSGKTATLVEAFCQLQEMGTKSGTKRLSFHQTLTFCAIGDNRPALVDRLSTATAAKTAFRVVTPLGFIEDEVMLFWPLVMAKLDLKVPFPLRLRPENEQELATELWLEQLPRDGNLPQWRLIRRMLDLMQLAALSLTPLSDLPILLTTAFGIETPDLPIDYDQMIDLLTQWQTWCLDHGFLTYTLTAQLYGQYLLQNPEYQDRRLSRYRYVLADDLDEYPPLIGKLLEILLDRGTIGLFSFNPEGAVRQGLGADPHYLETAIAPRCGQTLRLETPQGLAPELGDKLLKLIDSPLSPIMLPPSFTSLQTLTRAELIRQTAEAIGQSIESGIVQPQEIAVLGPGLDAISRYSFAEILGCKNITVELLNDQRPLSSTPLIRGLLTLLQLVYGDQGEHLGPPQVAEMLVALAPEIDPVRAGLLTEYCFQADRTTPKLLPVETFPRWDRIGHQAAAQYSDLVAWIAELREAIRQRRVANPVVLLDRAIQKFLQGGTDLPRDQQTALRELIETAQHYWTVEVRLPERDDNSVGRFVTMLTQGTVTANPFPVSYGVSRSVTLSTVFQYRASRLSHRWQFWFDGGSVRWLSGVDGMFGAPVFLSDWAGGAVTLEESDRRQELGLQRLIRDLLGRTQERVILCTSELGTNGQEQLGPLLPLATTAIAVQDLALGSQETVMETLEPYG